METFLSLAALPEASAPDALMLLVVLALGMIFGGASFYYKGIADHA